MCTINSLCILLYCTGDSNEHIKSVHMGSLFLRTIYAVTMGFVHVLDTYSIDDMHTIKGVYAISSRQCRPATLIAPAY